jgi:hypothetical protein
MHVAVWSPLSIAAPARFRFVSPKISGSFGGIWVGGGGRIFLFEESSFSRINITLAAAVITGCGSLQGPVISIIN